MPALASTTDLQVRLETTLTGTALARAQANLDDVSTLVRVEGSRDWGNVVDGALVPVPDEARLVTIQAALRAFRNPDGFAAENIGGAYSYTYGPGAQNGVYLNADEVRLVRIAAGLDPDGRPRGYLGSIRVPSAFDTDGVPITYVGDGIAFSDPIPLLQGTEVV